MLELALEAARRAGDAALAFYGKELGITAKADDSPLTLADRAADRAARETLERGAPAIPIISEETASAPYDVRRGWERLWLVDPLDGTKEFIKGTGEFTVNIALIENSEPVAGVVYVPAAGRAYAAASGEGAWRIEPDGSRAALRVRRADPERLVVVASRDHAGPGVARLIERLPRVELTSMGSALKICLVAEGKADFYPRLLPTWEWDTAAGHCVVEEAGGRLVDLSGRRLRYNKEDLRNPPFVVYADERIPWLSYVEGLEGS